MECFNKACVLNINECCGLKGTYISESGVCGKILVLEQEEMDVLEMKYGMYKEADIILAEKEEPEEEEIKETYGVTLPSGEPLTKSILHKMYIKECKPSRLIAELMGVNESVIKRYIREWGLTRNANKEPAKAEEKKEIVSVPTKRYSKI